MKYFTVGAVATYLLHRGPTTLPGSPPTAAPGGDVVLLHDTAGNANVFAGVLDALAGRFRAVAFDLPAHGRSGAVDSLGSIAAMAAHAKGLADRLGLASPTLVGDGMGAAVALEAAATWPDWPGAVVLVNSAAVSAAPSAADVEAVRQVTAGRARRQFDTSGYAPDTPKATYERAFGEWMKTDPRATVGDLEALVAWGRRDGLGAVGVPVTVVVGEHEPPEARVAAGGVAAAVARGRVAPLAGAGRRGVLEQPAGLAAIVAEAAEGVRP